MLCGGCQLRGFRGRDRRMRGHEAINLGSRLGAEGSSGPRLSRLGHRGCVHATWCCLSCAVVHPNRDVEFTAALCSVSAAEYCEGSLEIGRCTSCTKTRYQGAGNWPKVISRASVKQGGVRRRALSGCLTFSWHMSDKLDNHPVPTESCLTTPCSSRSRISGAGTSNARV